MNLYQCQQMLKAKQELHKKVSWKEKTMALKRSNSDKIMIVRWFLTNEMGDSELYKVIEKVFGLKGQSFEVKYRGLQLAVKGLSSHNFNLGLSLANFINNGGNPLDFSREFNIHADDANGNYLFSLEQVNASSRLRSI